MADTTYEVNIRMGGEWKFESRYGEFEKDEAIEDAKRVADTPGVEAVKVIKETYDAQNNTTRESTVFSTSKLARAGQLLRGRPDRSFLQTSSFRLYSFGSIILDPWMKPERMVRTEFR